ncbi:dipeptidase [Desulfospira joergensenii]|uniref:dipeptidase n=1 Tax=Desulfospira joergensenii TaxID=53329 RepID=UPI00041C653C|nr:membrane dipeptidase [Desulfospira joergensenii]
MRNFIVIDGHSDYPVQVFRERESGSRFVIEKKHLPFCTQGGVAMEVATVGGDFSNGTWNGKDPGTVLKTIAYIHQEMAESADSLRLVLTKNDLEKVGESGTLSMLLNLEGAACITGNYPLGKYYELGVRAMSLTHNGKNIFAHGCARDSGRGLSDLGRCLIEEINGYDMILDLVHINEYGFFEALDLAQRPPVVSHSNVKTICNSFRNLTDDQLKALSRRGGVVGLNCLGFLIDGAFENQTIDRLLDHLDYIVDLIGIDHVGFGPDYIDYMIDFTRENLKKFPLYRGDLQFAIGASCISDMQKFVDRLLNRGYLEPEVEKIMSLNFLRVYQQNLPE